MRRGLIAVACLVVFTQVSFAQTLDKAKFRQAIEMPTIATLFGVHFRSNERDGKGNKFDPMQKIVELEKKLTRGPDDAELLMEERTIFLECMPVKPGQAKEMLEKAADLLQKAEATLKPFEQTSDVRQAHLLWTYGAVLETKYDDKWNDCEKLARRAVALSPNDWRAWTYLAHVRQVQIPTILCGGNDKLLSRETRAQEAIGMLYLKQVRAELIDAAEAALNEAAQCHEKARQLAPNDPKRQTQRYGFRLTEVILRNALARSRDKDAPYPMQQLERVVLDELEQAARLNPDHLLWQSQLVHTLVLSGWQTNPDKGTQGRKTFKPARAEDKQAIQDAMARIEKIADAAQGETAAFCHSMLAALYSSMQDNAMVEKHARKVLVFDAKNQMAGEQLQQALLVQNRLADQLQVAQQVVKDNPSPRNCYLCAKALAANQRYDLAEQWCLVGLKNRKDDDLYCLMGLAALLMRKADDAQTLQTAGDILERARNECRPEAGQLAHGELEYLRTVHQALSGEIAIARLKLEYLQKESSDHARYAKLLSAFAR